MDAIWICMDEYSRELKDKDEHRFAWIGKKGYGGHNGHKMA